MDAILPVAILLVAAFVPDARPIAAAALLVGLVATGVASRRVPLAWAATVPVGISLAWPAILGPDVPLGAACGDPLSAIAVKRAVVAVAVVGLTAAVARLQGSSLLVLAVGTARWRGFGLAGGGLVALAVGGLVIGPLLAEPFFGQLTFARPLGAVVPALVFGVANGTLEEIAYRGALQGWLGRVVGLGPAIAIQALVFGLVHVGPEVTDLLPVHVALLAAAGLVAGLIAVRTGSLVIPIGVHVGADVALYFGLACRAAPPA